MSIFASVLRRNLYPTMTFSIVLDTNAVLDWLVFRDPALQRIGTAIETGQLRWLASTALRDELEHVLGRGVAAAWQPDTTAIWVTWERHCELAVQPVIHAAGQALRCSDTDDQKFIDFAIEHKARWLVTRDRAVLKLTKKAALRGLTIATPQHWVATPPP